MTWPVDRAGPSAPANDLTVGTRVLVIGREHPHFGKTGRLARAWEDGGADLDLDWVVRLDDGGEAGCASREVRSTDDLARNTPGTRG